MDLIEFMTNEEIQMKIVKSIENERIRKELTQKELCLEADINYQTYLRFVKKGDISLSRLVKLFITLDMIENLKGLIYYEEIKTIEDIRNKQKALKKRKRIKLKKDSYDK